MDMGFGAVEGKGIRFGTTASAFWSIATTVMPTVPTTRRPIGLIQISEFSFPRTSALIFSINSSARF